MKHPQYPLPQWRRTTRRHGTIPEDRAVEIDLECPVDEEGYPMYCWAKRRGGEGRCRMPAGHKTSHPTVGQCYLHGGATPNTTKGAKREIARREVVRLGISLNMSPHEALLATVKLAAGAVAFLARKVSQINPQDLVDGGEGATWYGLLREAQKDLTFVSAAAARAGVEERRTALAESQAEMIATTMRNILADLGIQETPEALEVVRKHMLLAAASEQSALTERFGEGVIEAEVVAVVVDDIDPEIAAALQVNADLD